MRRILLLAMLLQLCACNGAPLSTQWKLREFDLNTADLSQLRLAVRGPAWATPTPDRTVLRLRYWREGDEEHEASAELRLRRGARPKDAATLAQLAGEPTPVVYELAPQSLSPARALQAEARRLKAQGTTHGKIHIGGAVACRQGEIPPGPISVDAFIHASEETGWLPLLEQRNMRGDPNDPQAEAELATLVPPCGPGVWRWGER